MGQWIALICCCQIRTGLVLSAKVLPKCFLFTQKVAFKETMLSLNCNKPECHICIVIFPRWWCYAWASSERLITTVSTLEWVSEWVSEWVIICVSESS